MNDREIREEYKRVFDNIHASEELKNKILMQSRPRKRNFMPAIAAVTSAAAAFMIFTAVRDYDFEPDNSGVISTVVSEETSAPDEIAVQYTAEPAVTPEAEAEYTAPQTTQLPKITEKPKAIRVVSDTVSQNTTATLMPTETPAEAVTEPPTEIPTEPPQEESGGVQAGRGYRGVLLNINSPSVMPVGYAAAAAELYESDDGEYTVEEWDNDRYFNYIGTDILNGVEYSVDLVYTGGASSSFTVDSDGVPLNDTRIFTFSGGNGRFVRIVTSRETTYTDAVVSADGIALSNINGTNAAVFAENGEYSIYMIYSGASYIINTTAITEEEICTILATLTD